MEVIPGSSVGWTRTPNVMKITQLGPGPCADIETRNSIPQGQDFYARMYIRYDDTSRTFHPVTLNCCGDIQVALWSGRPGSSGSSYNPTMLGTSPNGPHIGGPNTGDPYAFGWIPSGGLPKSTWYRFEWFVDFYDSNNTSRIRIYPRIYNMSGTLVADSNAFRSGNTQTGPMDLVAWYNAGNYYVVTNLDLGRRFGLGNEGSGASTNTGLNWYYADVDISTSGWVGP